MAWARTLVLCHSELHLGRQDILEYPSLEFHAMLTAFMEIRSEMNKKVNTNPSMKPIDGVNTGDLDEEDYDTSEWFK